MATSTVTVTPVGGTPNYTYSFVLDNAAAGVYGASNIANLDPTKIWDVWVKDTNGCPVKLDLVIAKDDAPIITSPALQCYVGSPLNIVIGGSVDSDFTATEKALTSYSIGGAYQTSPNFTLNASGIYTLSIKDKNGCVTSTTYEVKPQLLLDANMTQDLTCLVSASVTLTANGGTGSGTYTYEVSYNGGTYGVATSPFSTSSDGTYQFRVTDSQGCQSVSNIITVTPKTTPIFTFVQTNVSCNSGNDGSIVVTPANGIAPYTFSKDNGTTFQPSNVFSGLVTGTYNIIVKDSKNCQSVVTPVAITQPTAVGGTLVLTKGLTCGAGNATQTAIVTAAGSGGTAPYKYSFDAGINYSTTPTYSTNIAGNVTVYIKDANGCDF